MSFLAGYNSDGTKLKDVRPEAAKQVLGLDKLNNTPDAEKSVKYAASAGSAKADGGNADTVDGFHASNEVWMLVPVVAFNVGENAGYIKLGNGLIVQWGQAKGDETDVVLPVAYMKHYSISLSINCHSDSNGWSRTGTYEYKTLKGFHVSVCTINKQIISDWLTIRNNYTNHQFQWSTKKYYLCVRRLCLSYRGLPMILLYLLFLSKPHKNDLQ